MTFTIVRMADAIFAVKKSRSETTGCLGAGGAGRLITQTHRQKAVRTARIILSQLVCHATGLKVVQPLKPRVLEMAIQERRYQKVRKMKLGQVEQLVAD